MAGHMTDDTRPPQEITNVWDRLPRLQGIYDRLIEARSPWPITQYDHAAATLIHAVLDLKEQNLALSLRLDVLEHKVGKVRS
jgi:hypothetical protein